MGLFSTQEERDEKEKRKAESDFAASPAGQAIAAKSAGLAIFQIDIPLSKTTGFASGWVGTFSASSRTKSSANLIQSIEEQGWRLEHVGYVYRVTGSVTTDKSFASGQRESTNGEIIGIYIFRAA
jgi:hypothetical protein